MGLQSVSSFYPSGDFCRLLITFANSLDSDQAKQNDTDRISGRFFEFIKNIYMYLQS